MVETNIVEHATEHTMPVLRSPCVACVNKAACSGKAFGCQQPIYVNKILIKADPHRQFLLYGIFLDHELLSGSNKIHYSRHKNYFKKALNIFRAHQISVFWFCKPQIFAFKTSACL